MTAKLINLVILELKFLLDLRFLYRLTKVIRSVNLSPFLDLRILNKLTKVISEFMSGFLDLRFSYKLTKIISELKSVSKLKIFV